MSHAVEMKDQGAPIGTLNFADRQCAWHRQPDDRVAPATDEAILDRVGKRIIAQRYLCSTILDMLVAATIGTAVVKTDDYSYGSEAFGNRSATYTGTYV